MSRCVATAIVGAVGRKVSRCQLLVKRCGRATDIPALNASLPQGAYLGRVGAVRVNGPIIEGRKS